MATDIKQFTGQILQVTPQYIDIFGNGVPGMAGRSAASAASANAGATTTQQLHRAALKFAHSYADRATGGAALAQQASDLEGLLLVAVTLGVLSQKDADQRIDELHGLLAERKPG